MSTHEWIYAIDVHPCFYLLSLHRPATEITYPLESSSCFGSRQQKYQMRRVQPNLFYLN